MNNVKLSVIVPVYNTKEYVNECLKSLANQSLKEIEILLINDGSTDGSGNLLKLWEKKDNRFKYVEQANNGLSAARNKGLELLTGEYVAFLDSDDWINTKIDLERMLLLAERENADIVAGNVLAVYPNQVFRLWDENFSVNFHDKEVMSGKDFFGRMIANRCYIPMVYNYIYKVSYIKKHNFIFLPNIVHEDELWTPQVLALAPKVIFSNIQHYCYRQRRSSIMNSTALDKRFLSLKVIIHHLSNFTLGKEKDYVEETFYLNILRLYFITTQICKDDEYHNLFEDIWKFLRVYKLNLISRNWDYYWLIIDCYRKYFNWQQRI